MLTTGEIYLNIEESDYKYTIEGISFYFSSKVYLEKFKNKVKEFISLETAKIYVRYKINLNLDLYFMIVLYTRIEKRGFRVYDEINKKKLTKNVTFINQLICY